MNRTTPRPNAPGDILLMWRCHCICIHASPRRYRQGTQRLHCLPPRKTKGLVQTASCKLARLCLALQRSSLRRGCIHVHLFSSRISFTQAPHAYTPPNEVRVRVRVRLGLGLAHAYTSPNEADPNLRASANLLQGRSCLMADLNLSSVADSESHSRRSALHMHTPALHMHTPALLCQLSPAGRYAYAYMSCASCLLEPCSPRSAYAYMAALHMHTCPVHPASRALLHGHTPTLARQPLHANPCTPTLARQPPCTGPLHWAEPLYS